MATINSINIDDVLYTIGSSSDGGGFRVYAQGVYGSVSWEYKTA